MSLWHVYSPKLYVRVFASDPFAVIVDHFMAIFPSLCFICSYRKFLYSSFSNSALRLFLCMLFTFFSVLSFFLLFCCLRFVLLSGWCAWAIFLEKRFKGIKENRQINELEKNVITKGIDWEWESEKKEEKWLNAKIYFESKDK